MEKQEINNQVICCSHGPVETWNPQEIFDTNNIYMGTVALSACCSELFAVDVAEGIDSCDLFGTSIIQTEIKEVENYE